MPSPFVLPSDLARGHLHPPSGSGAVPAQQALYRAARAALPAGVALTALHIDAAQAGVATGSGPEPARHWLLPLGTQTLAAQCLRHSPPSAYELELAIEWVEEQVMRLPRAALQGSQLVCASAALHPLAPPGAALAATLGQDAVEQAFNQLAALAQGRPASQAGVPGTPAFAASLVLLREFMHHQGFGAVTLWVGEF